MDTPILTTANSEGFLWLLSPIFDKSPYNCVKVKRPYNSPFTVQCFNDKTYPGGLLHDPSTFYTEKRRDSKHY